MLRIKDIMTKAVYTVETDASAEEAAWGLTRRHIGGAPAADAPGIWSASSPAPTSSIPSPNNGSVARRRSAI